MARSSGHRAAAALALVALVGGCSTADPGPSKPRDTALPGPVSGRLVRILGDGTWNALDRAGPAVTSSVNRPAALVAAPDGTLLGVQGTASFPGLFTVKPSGQAAPADLPTGTDPGPRRGTPVAATLADGHYLVALATGELDAVDPSTGALLGTTTLPAPGPAAWSSAFLTINGSLVLQYGDHWLSIAGASSGEPRVTPTAAPVADVVAAAPDGTGALVLADGRLVRLGPDGSASAGVAVALPQQVQGMTTTSATADGRGGLVLALATRTAGGFADSGAVVRVAADGGTTVLASGSKPGTRQDCRDADTAASAAHLAQPMSVVLWQDRIVVADTECNSLLTLPLTDG
jgi:hypothetical protein